MVSLNIWGLGARDAYASKHSISGEERTWKAPGDHLTFSIH